MKKIAAFILASALLFALRGNIIFVKHAVSAGGGDTTVSGHSTLAAKLVGAWELDETSGTRVDSHGSNDLTDNNTVTYATGVDGNASTHVDANDEYLSSSTLPFSGTGARATEIWFKTSDSGTAYIYGIGNGSSGARWRLAIESGSLWVRVDGGAGGWTGSWNDGNWHHVVLQCGASETVNDLDLYVDGSLETQNSGSTRAINTGGSNFHVGADSAGAGTNDFDGDLDMFRVYNAELTSGEISDLYNSGSGLPYD